MSLYFEGVTFSQQRLTAADDANVRRAVFNDCILRDCAFSFSGSDLTMDPGYLMVCGRQIRHPYVQTWGVTQTSGVARISLSVDVSWSGGREKSFQLTPEIEYAETAEQLPDLSGEDVNNGGSRYQAMLCILALSESGIIRIEEQITTLEVV